MRLNRSPNERIYNLIEYMSQRVITKMLIISLKLK